MTNTWALWYNPGMKVIIYARVSTKDKGQDCENQLAELRSFVAKKTVDGWKLSGEYEDYASGKSSERPNFRKLFEDAARRKFDLVLFWSLDRFSREGVLETLQHLQRLNSHGRIFAVRRCVQRGGTATIAKQERGRSGAGKTTVTDLVARFYDPTKGRILVNGVDIRGYRLRSYRGLLAIVQQHTFLFDGSVRDIAFTHDANILPLHKATFTGALYPSSEKTLSPRVIQTAGTANVQFGLVTFANICQAPTVSSLELA
jgi:hypothetical protein